VHGSVVNITGDWTFASSPRAVTVTLQDLYVLPQDVAPLDVFIVSWLFSWNPSTRGKTSRVELMKGWNSHKLCSDHRPKIA